MNRKKLIEIKNRYNDKVFDAVNIIIMCILLLVFVWPLWFVLIASFSNTTALAKGEVILWPVGFSFDSYKMMFEYTAIWRGYFITAIVTGIGTLINLALSICCAYPLSCKNFKPRKIITYMLMFTMYFNGGMIPTYMVVRNVKLLDSIWAMIIPSAISFYNCLIIRSYMMNSIPGELQEAATLDGANAAQYLFKVVLPLSKPVMAVVGLYYMVSHWNNYYSALLYIYDENLYPLQSVLRRLLYISSNIEVESITDPAELARLYQLSVQMKYSVLIAATLPVLCVYPFIQKHFVKGMMVGAVKG